VDAGIGPPRALNLDRAIEELFGRFSELPLHRSRIALLLPAAILCAVVFYGELPAFQLTSVASRERWNVIMKRF
jgi:hypothetical protein